MRKPSEWERERVRVRGEMVLLLQPSATVSGESTACCSLHGGRVLLLLSIVLSAPSVPVLVLYRLVSTVVADSTLYN